MDTTHDAKSLYVWIHGAPYQAPEVYIMAAPTMDLVEFRDRFVDTSRDYLIIRVAQVCDQPMSVDQECKGQRYHVTLAPVEEEILPGVDMVRTSTMRIAPGISLTAIKGIGRRYAALLHEKASIDSVQTLLAIGATPQGRDQLQSKTDLSPKLILKWVQLADLMRIEGIGSDYSQLLWDAGITSIPELATQAPKALLKRLTQVKEKQGGVRRLPYLEQVTDWIQKAANMAAVVTS
jgi:predicted flap endonuclease-1-like 5' DNA nuclease